ncbi:hypothetical protein EJB05_04208, partial [Eragrostis curvula]
MADEAAAPEPGPEASAGPAEPSSQAGAGDEQEDASAAGERCRAMMEVVATDGAGGKGKWKVSKLVVEHSHELQVAPGEVAATVPVLGMEFDSVEDAKGFYYGYGERVGFKARAGSNRRSVGDGEKIMQRFLCWRGNYTNRGSKGKDTDEGKELGEVDGAAAAAGKRKREPYKTRSRKPVTNGTEVIEIEKGVGMADAGNGRGSRRGRSKKDQVEKDGEPVAIEIVHDGTADDDEEDEGEGGEDGVDEEVQVVVKEKRGRGRPRKNVTEDDALQARVLRELGLRASQYDSDERKKILSKYLSKRQSRPASGRPTKIASRQALAERRKRGDGGRFLASEGHQNVEPSEQPSERRSKRLERQNLKKEEEKLLEQVEVLLQAKLHDKSSLSTILKGHQQNLLQNEVSNSEPRRATSKKNKNVEVRRQQQSSLDANKKKKGRQGLPEPEEMEIPLRVDPPTVSNDIPNHLRNPTNQFLAPSHIMQAPYVTQQFGLGSLQGFPGMSPFGQIQEPTPGPLQQPPHLQPPPFHSGPQIPQASTPDIQSLQFLSSNPQLGHQTTDQGQYTIPVWDFL